MDIGMLWLDADAKRPFDEKVRRAADYYREKYGRFPELCLVNKSMIADEKKIGRILVKTNKTVRLDHFWLGMNPA